ncbi:MAG: flavin reductase family protein [Tissierellia bacterium]|nr:flavin reductase family protein [Tissierellia bacterium]
MKKKIDVFDYSSHILKELQKGVLVTTKVDDRVNTMSISWGTLGIQWNRPIFTIFVREGRFTKDLLEKNPEFTINIPYGEIDEEIIEFCGTKSGREIDKVKELNLSIEESDLISVPGIKEFPLTLECKVIYKQKQDVKEIPYNIMNEFYPEEGNKDSPSDISDIHTAYYGEIVSGYIIE